MKHMKRYITLVITLLLLGGIANEAWAYKVTYHILTKPIDNDIYHLNDAFSGKRLEAVRVVDNSATTVDLPAPYKSPLATNFKYYDFAGGKVSKSSTAEAMYSYSANNKSYYYSIEDGATDIAGNAVSSNLDVYVTYDYDADNTIYKLDGSKDYNLSMSGGFLAFNRGRNNRVAIIPESANRVSAEALASDDFVKVDVSGISGTNITNYWNSNRNPRDQVAGQFFFKFQLVGEDPYNILIRTAYNKNYTYIEKHGNEGSTCFKYYKDSYLFWPSSESSGFFLASDDHKQYTQESTEFDPNPKPSITSEDKTGYFKSKGGDLTYNSFALLNNTGENGYLFMITRYVDKNGDIATPGHYTSASYRFLTRDNNYNNLKSESKTLAQASASYSTDDKTYLVNNYIFKVKTPFDNYVDAEIEWSDAYKEAAITDMVPESLKRKYTTITGFYANADFTNAVATFAEAQANCTPDVNGKYVIYVKYTVNTMPFETLPVGGSYADARWYQMTDAASDGGKKIKWDATYSVFKNNGADGDYSLESDFAFIGNPYELRIINRKLTVDHSGNVFVGSSSRTTNTDLTTLNDPGNGTEGAGFRWEIPYDAVSGSFTLREMKSTNAYWQWDTTEGNNLNYSTSASTRIKVLELPKINYVYHIVRDEGTIAVKATESQDVGKQLQYSSIPEIIRSPFIGFTDATTSYYWTLNDAKNKSNAKTNAPLTIGTEADKNIYVRYDISSIDNNYKKFIDGNTAVNVRLNGQYIYYDSGTIKSNSSPTNDELGSNAYLWHLGGSDPYAMTIKNDGANQYVTANATDQSALGWNTEANATKFIIKSGNNGVYEVMYATGESVDAGGDNPTYYNIGRDDTGTKMFKNTTYPHGYDQLRFQLTLSTAHDVTYHLIDKSNTELLTVVERHSADDDPEFPNEYRSPLVAQYHYWTTNACNAAINKIAELTTDVYVTYDTGDDYDLQNKKTMYLLKYDTGDNFRQEDGSDGLLADATPEEMAANTYKYKAVYPYCNGDGNFFVYGQEQYDIQQQSAASTRTRWAWFLESVNNDPYHVKICSRQIETYNGYDTRAYFRTYVETFGDDTKHVVTNLSWPGISGEEGTEYMILGSTGQFRLVTSDAVDDGATNVRRIVNSFEQYWKTWNTIRKKVLGDEDAVARQSDPNIVPETPATDVATAAGKNNRTYLTDVMGWHSYEQWAYAIRWNDYNKNGDKNKKGWEDLEHWFQTVNMGEGYFNLEPVTIDPVLILLDQHGWEIMRKPLPSSPTDPDKDDKYNAIRPYDSPMVKEYHFWGSAKKRTGFHQYYELSGRMKVDGEDFVSTSLTTLPDYYNSDGTRNTTITDAKGNQLDEYVTYVVKDEYVQGLGEPFMIQQGSHFASATDATTLKNDNNVPATGGMSQYIIDNISTLTTTGDKNNELWLLKPNPDIDIEMGYQDATKFPEGYAHDWTNDYTKTDFSASGFDPYNIQISSVANTSSYFVTDATTAQIDEGSITGNGATNKLGTKVPVTAALSGGMDNRTLQITNATFMAVQDAAGNMQLMPRFDHSKRLKDFSTLTTASDDGTYTKLYRPQVYTYKIIDNDGHESLRYQGGGDLVPQTPDWFKSPLAKDFKYYAGVEGSTGQNEIAGSLRGASLADNTVYVRYSYDEDADELAILKGKWLTMQLNAMDAKYDSGIKQGDSKPATINDNEKTWQWKFLKTPQSVPDPYAVQLFNRSVKDAAQPATDTRYAILSHTNGNYALAQAGLDGYTYKFLNGAGMTTSVAASLAEDKEGENTSGFTSTSCTFHGTDSQVKLINDVSRRFNYQIYTNSGVLAVSAYQDNIIEDNTPTLPDEIKSPLLKTDQFRYYEALTDTAANSGKQLKYLYGLYDDIVYVRYNAYDLLTTEYKVPNVRNATGGTVAKGEGSNDASLDINGELIYNIIWYDDNMMQSANNSDITGLADQDLQGGDAYVWQFEGNDPYAIKIKHQSSRKYAVGTSSLADTPTSTFMLLPASDSWQYGVLQVTGDTDKKKLTTVGNALTPNASTTPTKFIIFGLSTHKVIYHLVIAKSCPNTAAPATGEYVDIPYRETKGGSETTKRIFGSSWRDLTTGGGATYQLGSTINGVNYCVDDGHITLGDPLKVPEALERPNCKYFFYVEGVYTNEDCSRAIAYGTEGTHISALDAEYRGLQITEMGTEPELLGTTVRINIEYQFDDGLPTNNGSDFVTNTTGTQWYTFETSDATPYLAHYTYKDAKLTGIAGRVGHYTNDFLWSPVGDPYGFKMYNRYVYKNGGETTKVMTTENAPAADADLIMAEGDGDNKPVYELLQGYTDGYFKVQTLTVQGGTPYYIDNSTGTLKLKTSTNTEWHFGLDQSLFDPYYLGAGNVGGLTTTPKTGTSKTKSGKVLYEEATNLIEKQAVVFDPDNIVDFTPGYYRIFSQPNSQGIKTPQYLSGYTHKTELTSAIPMHFYEKEGVTTTFDILGSGFTSTTATQGQIPIEAPEYDPASIFYISGSGPYTMQTQGLYVYGAAMTESSGSATSFEVVDIGGAVVLLRDNSSPDKKYLHYKQTGNIYDVKFEPHGTFDDDDASKWCMEPANKKGLWIETHSGGEEAVLSTLWYYSSYCVPFDMLISNKDDDPDHSSNAYTCVAAESPWSENGLHPKPIGKYTKDDTNYPAEYRPEGGNDYFVPAGTPVLFSTRRATSYIKATIPTTTPSKSISTIFSAKYLEQLLPSYDDNKRVYVFGPKMEGTFIPSTTTGEITAVLPSLGNTNVGFHINANLNKESGLTPATWTRNNYYVLHNRIYYKSDTSGASAPSNRAIEFVPVIFDDEEGDEEISNKTEQVFDGRVYNLQGRCVATEEQVKDGTWRDGLAPGIYIVNGKKLVITRK